MGSQAGTLKIWDLEAARLVRTHTGEAHSCRRGTGTVLENLRMHLMINFSGVIFCGLLDLKIPNLRGSSLGLLHLF
jgi:hypothetical protein